MPFPWRKLFRRTYLFYYIKCIKSPTWKTKSENYEILSHRYLVSEVPLRIVWSRGSEGLRDESLEQFLYMIWAFFFSDRQCWSSRPEDHPKSLCPRSSTSSTWLQMPRVSFNHAVVFQDAGITVVALLIKHRQADEPRIWMQRV